ncbi:MAG TPA: DUF3151 domain-containing protein [Actinomycetota bacterium]|nr:DUF3151 domain-containing protein [Actinomycetota bacterium]
MAIPISEPSKVLLEEPAGSLEELGGAQSAERAAEVARKYPSCLTAWAVLGEEALAQQRFVDAYAYFRVGYHRGLDGVRKAGWKGSGIVPWSHEPNRGFLRSLAGLGKAAEAIGENDEAVRCEEFLRQLAPDAP